MCLAAERHPGARVLAVVVIGGDGLVGCAGCDEVGGGGGYGYEGVRV